MISKASQYLHPHPGVDFILFIYINTQNKRFVPYIDSSKSGFIYIWHTWRFVACLKWKKWFTGIQILNLPILVYTVHWINLPVLVYTVHWINLPVLVYTVHCINLPILVYTVHWINLPILVYTVHWINLPVLV